MEIPKYKYFKLELDDLKEGNMFFVTLDSINGIMGIPLFPELIDCHENNEAKSWQYDADLEDFQYNFYSSKCFTTIDEDEDMLKTRSESITLVKYLGNRKFLEYYTGLIISYTDYGNEEFYKPYANPTEFMKAYDEHVKNPLLIGYGMLLPIDNVNFRRKFVKQEEQKDYIKNTIYAMHNECIDNLQEDFKKMIKQDRMFADIENEAENMIRTFAKTEPKKY